LALFNLPENKKGRHPKRVTAKMIRNKKVVCTIFWYKPLCSQKFNKIFFDVDGIFLKKEAENRDRTARI